MQFKRNRRIMLIQDITLACLVPILLFLSIGSLQIGSWNTGEMFSVTVSSEIMEDCRDDFYMEYTHARGDELGETISFSPLSIWQALLRGGKALLQGLLDRSISITELSKMPENTFAESAELLAMIHILVSTLFSTVFQGFLYLALFVITAVTPLLCLVRSIRVLVDLLGHLKDPRERHRRVVLTFRKAVRPFFIVLLLVLLLPDARPGLVWLSCMGVYLVSVIWNFVASRLKRNTKNETEFLNFIQFFSFGGVALTAGALLALDRSGILSRLYERISNADGLEILTDSVGGDFEITKLLLLLLSALFFAGIGLTVRYLYYGSLRVACILESSRHKKVEHEGLVAVAAVMLGALSSVFLLLEASGRQAVVLEDGEFVAFLISLGSVLLVLILEILQRIFCYLNRLDRAYRNDLLCGCTEDRMYSTDAVIGEGAPTEDTPAKDAPTEDAPVEDAPVEDAPAEDAPTEDAPAEEVPAEEVPAEEVPTEDAPAEEVPAEDAPAEDAPAEDVPVEEVPTEDAPAEEVPAEDTPAEDAPTEDAPTEDAPTEDVPTEEVPAEDTPAEDAPRT